MSNHPREEMINVVKEGRKAVFAWRERNPFERMNLCRVQLPGVDLALANLRDFDLVGADLSMAKLVRAYLSGADLRDAKLENADLRFAALGWSNLHGADLKQANLTGAYPYKAEFASADLRGTDFTNAYCNEADFSNAVLGGTNFSSTNLSNASGLESCTYSAPVFADSMTLLKSGSLPPVFLEHCVSLPEKDHDKSNRLN